jgi:hypothetical protein
MIALVFVSQTFLLLFLFLRLRLLLLPTARVLRRAYAVCLTIEERTLYRDVVFSEVQEQSTVNCRG